MLKNVDNLIYQVNQFFKFKKKKINFFLINAYYIINIFLFYLKR
jgi:hypothetical protein